ncbi:MAG TPA: Dps family protein [Burkholderiaceae bacterium]|nr:Dps family protein [Burkholderiaceae bacterium]
MEPKIGLSSEQRQQVINALERVLADVIVLYFGARGAHWNVVGPNFGPLHEFFGEQYEQLDEEMDEVAERIRALGGRAPATIEGYARAKRIDEGAGEAKSAADMIGGLLGGHEALIRQLRDDIEVAERNRDDGTADFLTGLLEDHEKMAWMLRAHLQ